MPVSYFVLPSPTTRDTYLIFLSKTALALITLTDQQAIFVAIACRRPTSRCIFIATMEAAFVESGTTVDKVRLAWSHFDHVGVVIALFF